MAARRSGKVRFDELVLVSLLFGLLFGAEGQAVPAACPATCTDAQAYFIASPTATTPFTFGAIANNFNMDIVALAGANNEDLADFLTFGDITVQGLGFGEVRVPLPSCSCKGGVYTADNVTYTVQPGDSLFAIATVTYGGLVYYLDIATANNISDPSLIQPGQQFVIPIPCTCVARPETPPAVALSYVIVPNDDYTLVASEFNTNVDAVVALNPSANSSALLPGQVIEVPLPACSFNLSTGSLLVAYDAWTVTADTCVQCKCSASETGDPTGVCVPSPPSAPCSASVKLTCPGTNLTIGSSSAVQKTASSCEVTTCSYDGYSTSSGILTKLQNETVTGICPEIAPPPPPPTPAGAPPPQASPPTTSPPASTLFPPPPPTKPGSNPGSGSSAPPPASPAVLNEAWPALILATCAAILSTLV